MPNSIVELHDSRLTRIHMDGTGVALEVDAYVHVSEGVPGVDAGSGWRRPIRITMQSAVVRKEFEGAVLWITDGVIRLDETVLENLMPLAFEETGRAKIELVGHEGRFLAMGLGLRVEPVGCPPCGRLSWS